jgi:hypothetical protein
MFPMNTLLLPIFITIYAITLPAPVPAILTIAPNRSHPSHDYVLSAGTLSDTSFMETVLRDRLHVEGSIPFPPSVRILKSRYIFSGTMRESLWQESG